MSKIIKISEQFVSALMQSDYKIEKLGDIKGTRVSINQQFIVGNAGGM